jgi:hypothetical protein
MVCADLHGIADRGAPHFVLTAVQGRPERGLSHHCHHCWEAPPTASLCSHPLFSLRKLSASVVECQWVQFFSAWRNSVTNLCTSMTYAILSDYSSAVICRMTTILIDYWREGSTSTVIPPISASNVMGQHNKIGCITFGAPLVIMYENIFISNNLILIFP